MLKECWSTGSLMHYWWECKLVQPPLENSLAPSPEVKRSGPLRPSKSSSCIYKRDSWTFATRSMYKNVLSSNAYNTETLKQPKCLKLHGLVTQWNLPQSSKQGTWATVIWMNLSIILSENKMFPPLPPSYSQFNTLFIKIK